MIKLALLLVMWMLAIQAHAASASAAIQGLKSAAGSYTLKSSSATAANGKFYTSATIQQAGQTIQMPASASFAANAASFAIGAARLNPAGLVIGLTASWLLERGLQYANSQWQKNTTGSPDEYRVMSSGVAGVWRGSREAAAADYDQYLASIDWHYIVGQDHITISETGGTWGKGYVYIGAAINPAAYNTGNKAFFYQAVTPTTTSVLATEADFTAAGNQPITDGAAGELVKVLDMPIQAPVIDPAPVDSFSEPYLDPITGRMVKEQTRVTPQPTTSNPLNVRLEKYQVDAGAVPGQTTAPVAPTKEANISNQPSNIEFPSDYARQGEAQTAADSINNTLGPKLDKITETGADPADPTEPQASQFDQAFFQGTFTSLLAWQLPAHSSQCPTSSFGWNGQTFTLDSHCQLVTDHFAALAVVMTVVWTVLGLFILLRA